MKTYRQTHTRTDKNGFTTLQKTGDAKTDAAIYQIEDALSYLYYSDLENDRGLKNKAEDLSTASGFLSSALETLNESL